MYIERVPNRNSPPCYLLRESYREGGKVKKRTLANLTHWPEALREQFRVLLKGGVALPSLTEGFDIVRSLPHGHVAAVLGTLRRLKLERLMGSGSGRMRALAVAMIVARVIDPRSKLATARGLRTETALSTLGAELGVEDTDEDELYAAMDWLVERQGRIEAALGRRHLSEGALVLYDVTSSYLEGRTCRLGARGYSRDKKRGKLQIVFGLLCTRQGCPVGVEVFEGNTADPATLASQVEKVRERFGLKRVVWVGDRGLITEARIREELSGKEGLGWITALRGPQIRKLREGGALQLSLFDERDLGEIQDPAYPGERLVVCRNPFLAAERARKRQELVGATKRALDKIVQATQRAKRPLRGRDKIGVRVGRVMDRYKVAKHFVFHIEDERFSYELDPERIEAEQSLDGIYVIRTNVPSEELRATEAVEAYKGLSVVEQAFRSYKSVDLKVRPIHHRLEKRVRAHIFLCMLAYYVEWHMRRDLAPMLFDDHDREGARAQRRSVVAPARRSEAALAKVRSKRTEEGLAVHSFQTLLADLGTIAKSWIQPKVKGVEPVAMITRPTPIQQRALELLKVKLM